MNTLSWFIYFADISPSLSTTLGISSVFALVGMAVVGTVATITSCEPHPEAWGPPLLKGIYRRVWIPIAVLIVATLLPSENTMYAIAASEMGERLTHTQTFSKAEQALNAWLDKQVEDAPKQEEEK